MLAWRDLDDPEAGGSELHAANIAALWAEAGLEVTMRTSFAAGHPQVTWRDGYRVIRKAGRYLVFPRAAISEVMGWHGGRDGLVEIWNGMPFFSPLWSHTPHVTWLHHVHAEMWKMTLPPRLAAFGNFVESRLAPPIYRNTSIVTLSESSKRSSSTTSTSARAGDGRRTRCRPALHAGRNALAHAARRGGGSAGAGEAVRHVDRRAGVPESRAVPALEAVIVGEGYSREQLEAKIRDAAAESWITLPGRVSEEEKVDLYRRAWVLASASAREGWGMTVTEAAACGTPSVVTNVAGHADAVVDGVTGLLADRADDFRAALGAVLRDRELRERLSVGAREHAARFTWEATARGTLQVLADAALAHRPRT